MRRVARPLLNIHCITEQNCDYPVALRVTMDDGTVQTYNLENKTFYQFRKVLESLDRMTVGYQYRGGKRRSRIHRGKL